MAIRDILGDYRAFFDRQLRRLAAVGIDPTSYPVGHLAFRTETQDEYLSVRDRIEALSVANVENQWNGRPISKLLLTEPLHLGPHHSAPLIELIPPPHQRAYPMRLEHVGFVLGDDLEAFAERHRSVITEQQDQGPFNPPLLITFEDGTSVKFHRHSLHDVVVMEGQALRWVPPRRRVASPSSLVVRLTLLSVLPRPRDDDNTLYHAATTSR